MGATCFEDRKNRKERNNQKSKLKKQIKENEDKIKQYENQLNNIENQIKERETEIKNNKSKYNRSQLQIRVNKLISIDRDRQRCQKAINSLNSMNENLKNNLMDLEIGQDIINNAGNLEDQNRIMDKMGLEMNGINYQENIDNLLKHKNQINNNLNILENGNNLFFGNDNMEYQNHLYNVINNREEE